MPIHSLMFGWEYPPMNLGGLGVACRGIVRGLTGNGVKITLVLPSSGAQENGVEIISTDNPLIKTFRVKSMMSPYDNMKDYALRATSNPRKFAQMYGSDLQDAVEWFSDSGLELAKKADPDVIHCHDWMTYPAGMLASKYCKKPLVAHIHATEMDRTNFQPDQWIYDTELGGFRSADSIIAVSNYTKDILVSHYGIPSDKIKVVHNGSDGIKHNPIKAGPIERKNPLVLFLGRLTIQKGPAQFLEMAAKVNEIDPKVMFIIAGDGNMTGELMTKACELGLSRNVIFAGRVSSSEAHHLYSHADCFVMSSLSEPFGLVALEAVEHGVPVILTKQSGASEVVNHAFKIDYWDTEKMADCVLTILKDKRLSKQLKSRAFKDIRHLTWENQAAKIKSIYENLIYSMKSSD